MRSLAGPGRTHRAVAARPAAQREVAGCLASEA